jgi:hypothetical protein
MNYSGIQIQMRALDTMAYFQEITAYFRKIMARIRKIIVRKENRGAGT